MYAFFKDALYKKVFQRLFAQICAPLKNRKKQSMNAQWGLGIVGARAPEPFGVGAGLKPALTGR
jgi:hypothetical protein